ncbi:fungal-specific transcription factor domain-containing protein [Paraphoma chrysanthemicola]|nr:fungal-specific transcription factor domain-containing protein [Paraphoma chrysanthemicola]
MEMNSPARPSTEAARRVTACQRCRRRKQKCDLKHPNCSNCESANVRCLIYHLGKHAELPRNYVTDLEAQVQKLQREVQDLRARNVSISVDSDISAPHDSFNSSIREINSTPTDEPATPTNNPNHLQDLVKTVRNVVVEPSKQPRFLGQSSGITLARMVMASIRTDHLPASFPQQASRNRIESRPTSDIEPAAKSSLPPRHAANHLVEVYFQYRTPHLPIVERPQVEKAMRNAYLYHNASQPNDAAYERDMFITYMVLAIALCNVPNPTGGTSRVLQSEGCFRSAIGWVEKVIAYSKTDLESLRAVLLLAQFVSMCPWQGSLWHLAGIALRLCIDIGLHWESEGQALDTAPDILYERRRLWYSAYQFDRILGITLGRPFGITDESMQVPLPNPWAVTRPTSGVSVPDFSIQHQQAHNHLFSMARLQSEIKHVQQSRTWPAKLAYPRPNFDSWVRDIQPRIQEWHGTIPPPDKAHPSSIFANQAYWDAVFNDCVLLLYRPNSSNQHVPIETLLIAHEAACNLVASIKILQREGKLDVLWRSVHQLFMAGLTIIYGLWQSKEMRDRNPISSSISALQSCASTLSAMSETFHGAIGCRDVFDTLSSVTIDWLVTSDTVEPVQTRLDFEKQVEDLLQQLNPSREAIYANESRAMDMSDMISTDIFAFGEMLNSAAQWPEYPDLDFVNMDLDQPWNSTGIAIDPYLDYTHLQR